MFCFDLIIIRHVNIPLQFSACLDHIFLEFPLLFYMSLSPSHPQAEFKHHQVFTTCIASWEICN